MSPLQGFKDYLMDANPGRCPGLACCRPFGTEPQERGVSIHAFFPALGAGLLAPQSFGPQVSLGFDRCGGFVSMPTKNLRSSERRGRETRAENRCLTSTPTA